jgi:hypothetical protein
MMNVAAVIAMDQLVPLIYVFKSFLAHLILPPLVECSICLDHAFFPQTALGVCYNFRSQGIEYPPCCLIVDSGS